VSEKEFDVRASEEAALEHLRESPDPMVRVIYSMSMRQLAATERLIRIEDELIRQGGIQRRLVDFLDRKYSNGSHPNLKAVILGDG